MCTQIRYAHLREELTLRRVVVNSQIVYGFVNRMFYPQLFKNVVIVQKIAQSDHGPVIAYSRALFDVIHFLDQRLDNPQVVHPLAPVIRF